MNLLTVDTIDEARRKLENCCEPIRPGAEKTGLLGSAGRILAEDIKSSEDIPPYRRSTMDGYAVRSRDTAAAGDMIPSMLKITGEVKLGEDLSGLKVEPGCCVYVPTGGEIPDGADAVIMVEYCEAFGDGMLAVSGAAAPGENVVQPGEDIARDSVVLKKGRRLRPQDIGVLAALGVTSVPVFKPWRLTLISTGDELVKPEEIPGAGQIRDINSYSIAARSREEGFELVRMLSLKDDRDEIAAALEKARKDSDVVMLSGGSSQGKKDMTAELIGSAADQGVLTHGLAAKPGKPSITGFDVTSRTLFIGLPGHPAAALMIYEQLLIKTWRLLTEQTEERTVKARLKVNVPSAPGRRTFQPVRLTEGETPEAEPVFARSGMISPLSRSDGYFEMSENQEGARPGDTVEVHLW